jgi:LuxR family transcriptional regulator, maltose regulon positive regulatory protein
MVAEGRLIVETKLARPVNRPGLVVRSELIERILESSAPVVLVAAPVGYGKTTLVVQYTAATERPVAWVSLDPADDDPGLLLSEIAMALDRIAPVEPRVLRRLAAAGLSLDAMLPELVGLLGEYADLALVLDDVHLVRSPASVALLSSLSQHVPRGRRLILISREAPPVPRARLRARGLLLELGQDELALGRGEATALLGEASVELDTEASDALYDRVEGWAAGLYLAALSLHDETDASGAVRDFAGDDRDVVDYLSGEVLARQPDERVAFLLSTSLLDRFTAPLCDAVLQRSDSARMIDDLERLNLFVVPLDRRREWYRYHHLFSEMLRGELARRQPGSECLVHRRAAAWHEQSGTLPEAIEHAFAGGDRRRAAELVSQNARLLYNSGLQATIERWLGSFSEAEAADYPPLAIIMAWAGGLLGNKHQSLRCLKLVDGTTFDGPLPLGERSLESAIAILRAAHGWEGVSKMRSDGETGYRLEQPRGRPDARPAIFFAAALVLSGKSADAIGPFEEAAAIGGADANGAMFALGMLGLTALDEGRLEDAEARLGESLALIDEFGLGAYVLAGPTHAGLGCLYVARGALDDARPFLERAVAVIPRAASWPWLAIHLRVLAGRVAIAIGELALAGSLLTDARRELARYPDAGILPRLLAEQERALDQARGGQQVLPEPLTKAEQRVLDLLPTHLTVEEIGRSLYVSRNTVKGHLRSIYRKLDVSSRGAAVARARTLGLGRPASGPG